MGPKRNYPGAAGRGRGRGGRVATPAIPVKLPRVLPSQSPSPTRTASRNSATASPSPVKRSSRPPRTPTRGEYSRTASEPESPSSFELEATRSPSSSPSRSPPAKSARGKGKRGGGSVARGQAKRGRGSASGGRSGSRPAVATPSKTTRPRQNKKTPTKKSKPIGPTKKTARAAPPPRDDVESSADSDATSPAPTSNSVRSPSRAEVSVAAGRSRASVAPAPGPKSKSGRKSTMAKRTPSPSKKNTHQTKRQLDTPIFIKRYRPPPKTKSIMEIQYYQRSTDSLIPLMSFSRLVKEVTMDITNQPDLRWKMSALEALQAASEAYLVGLFEDSNLITMHCRRVTLYPKDLRLAHRIRGDAERY